MKFLIDENLSSNLAMGMVGFGEDVVHLRDVFGQGAADASWLERAGTEGWMVITRDDRIRHRPLELHSYRAHRVGGFVLAGKNRSRCDLIEQLVKNWRRMKALAEKTKRPFLMRVAASGSKIEPIPLQ